MSALAEKFIEVNEGVHTRVKSAIKNAMDANFVIEEEPVNRKAETFSRKSIDFFVREKIDPKTLFDNSSVSSTNDSLEPETQEEDTPSDIKDNVELKNENVDSENDLENLEKILTSDDDMVQENVKEQLEPVKKTDEIESPEIVEQKDGQNGGPPFDAKVDENSGIPAAVETDASNSQSYEEGFVAGRAAALSELEEQEIDQLAVLKSIANKMSDESFFDFEAISAKIMSTVNELSSERCGILIDEYPEKFSDRIVEKLEQLRNLTQTRHVFFNETDLESLKTLKEFDEIFENVNVRVNPNLLRGDVVVKVGAVEVREAAFTDQPEDS